MQLVVGGESFVCPAKLAFYWKAAFVCWLFNKKPTDFKYEVLEEEEIDLLKQQEKEMKYIEKFNSERKGFNGPFAKQFQIMRSLEYKKELTEKQKQTLIDLYEKQEKINNDLKKDLEKCEFEKYTPWLGFQMSIEANWKNQDKHKNYYFKKIEKVLQNIEQQEK